MAKTPENKQFRHDTRVRDLVPTDVWDEIRRVNQNLARISRSIPRVSNCVPPEVMDRVTQTSKTMALNSGIYESLSQFAETVSSSLINRRCDRFAEGLRASTQDLTQKIEGGMIPRFNRSLLTELTKDPINDRRAHEAGMRELIVVSQAVGRGRVYKKRSSVQRIGDARPIVEDQGGPGHDAVSVSKAQVGQDEEMSRVVEHAASAPQLQEGASLEARSDSGSPCLQVPQRRDAVGIESLWTNEKFERFFLVLSAIVVGVGACLGEPVFSLLSFFLSQLTSYSRSRLDHTRRE